jgi:hypothetical protein
MACNVEGWGEWGTGLLAFAVICAVAMVGLAVVRGFICAVSVSRWTYRCAKTHGNKLYWRKLPFVFIRDWLTFLGHRSTDKVTLQSACGCWTGVGQGYVYPPKPPTKAKA